MYLSHIYTESTYLREDSAEMASRPSANWHMHYAEPYEKKTRQTILHPASPVYVNNRTQQKTVGCQNEAYPEKNTGTTLSKSENQSFFFLFFNRTGVTRHGKSQTMKENNNIRVNKAQKDFK